MDTFRQKRSKVCTADRSSGGRALREGNRRVQKHRNYPAFASESSSSSSGITDEDSLMLDLGWRSSNQAAGTPMKKLLAKEMTPETEHRKRSQGVIARLMGLETLPPQQPSPIKQQKRRTEENRSTTKVEKSERSSPFSSHRSSRKSSREEQEFKDVYEVVETPKSRKIGHRPAVTGRSGITEDEMEFIRRKFMEAKRLSTDDKLHHSKEFHDTIEVLDSNRDLLLKFLQQPDSLFTKHLHDLHGPPLQSHYGRRTSAESSVPQSKTTLGRDRIGRSCEKSFQKHRVSSHLKPTISPDKVEPSVVPTRIVVLKPNLGRTKNSATCVSSPTSHTLLSDSSSFSEFPISSHKDNESSRSRKIAKEVTREIKSALSSRGCSADESSSTGNNSADEESDITILTSRKSLYSNHHRKPSSSGESSVTREAEAVRRLSRRWRMSHRSQEIEEISRGSTLADMLALTDRDLRHQNMEAQRVRQKLASSVVREPLGISSRDGWKDVFVNGLSRSRSVPNSLDFLGSPKSSLRIESPRNCRYTVPTEVMKWEKNKKVVREKATSRKAESYYFTRGESSNASPEIHIDSNFQKSRVVSETPAAAAQAAPSNVENLTNSENDNDALPLSPETKKQSDLPSKECPDPAMSKEAEQPSPVSTLEAPFTDDVSSGSECFESLCADLHGLRMQLQLLKLESESYTGEEDPLSVLSDEDAALDPTRSSSPSKPSRHVDETWESSYVTEVLTASGYDKPDPDTFMTKLHSLDCPINPSHFEHLEKSYQINYSGPGRPERKLLFDRINSGLVEIYQQLSDPHPWVCSGLQARENVVGLEIGLIDGLRKSVQSRERKLGKGRMESEVSSESKWLSLGGEMDLIGREIERLVMDEMLAEVIGM